MRMRLLCVVAATALVAFASASFAGMNEAKKWVDEEFQPSTLSKSDQMKEMEWFIKAAAPFKGMEINVLSETIPTHEYESKVLTKAFEEITGIKVNHQLLGEGEVVQAVQTQMQTGRNLYDAYINDSDLIGTHSRLQLAVNLTDWMAGVGVILAGAIAGHVMRRVLKAAMLSWADRLGGAALGLVAAALIAALIVLPLVAYTPYGESLLTGSVLAPYVSAVADLAATLLPAELTLLYQRNMESLRQAWRDQWNSA